jgi:tetratricopeptide (TPR) repeat protein
LEGRVQRDADRIRVNVQLIDASADEHVWAEIFDRRLTANNILDIQSEIVDLIVRQLDEGPTPTESQERAVMPTDDLAAYTAYLTGKTKSDIESIESLNVAIESFTTAVRLDPNFALAYVALADAYLRLSANFLGGLPSDESAALAEPPLVRALALNESLPEAHVTLGLLRQVQGNEEAAEQAYEKSIALNPAYPRAWRLYGRLRWQQGRLEEAMDLMRNALRLDPNSTPVSYDIARLYDESGYFEEAMAGYLRVIEIEPNHAFAYVYIAAIHYLVYGRVDESLVWYQKAANHDALSPSLQSAQAMGYLELGDPDSAKEWVDRGLKLKSRTFWPLWTSLLHSVYVGDQKAAQTSARAMLELNPRWWGALHVLRNFDLAAGRYEAARSRYARAFRELTEPEVPKVDPSNFRAAIDLALVLLLLDEKDRANDLLEGSLRLIGTMPRLGINGYDICDVRILALQQRPERALDALREAVDGGWRLWSWFYLENDPNLNSIRDEPEFQRLYAKLRADLAIQAQHVQQLQASGEL